MRRGRLALLFGLSACANLAGLSGGDGGAGAGGDGGDGGDGAAPPGDATTVGPDGSSADGGNPATPPTLASTGGVLAGTGAAQQQHLLRATASGRWLFFYLDDTTGLLHARTSTDFSTWTPSTDLVLPSPHNGDGRNFSVAYASLGGKEIVHVAIGLQVGSLHRMHHARGVLGPQGTITYDPVGLSSSVNNSPAKDAPVYDGTSTSIASDGTVYVASGWGAFKDGGAFNATTWTSMSLDMGASWMFGFSQDDVQATTRVVNAHQLLTGPGAPVLGYLWERADQEPNPTNVSLAGLLAGNWISFGSVFGTDAVQDTNDWGAAILGTEAHVLRWSPSRAFEHVKVVTTGGTMAMPSPPNDAPLAAGGVVPVSDGARLSVVALSRDPGNPVRISHFDGATWGPWSTLVPAGGTRSFLAGASAPGHAAVVWSESRSSVASDVLGAIVY